MMAFRIRVALRLAVGVPTLLVGASCVPNVATAPLGRAPQAVASSQALLRGMALSMPVGVADQPLAAEARPIVLAGGAPPFVAAQTGDDADRALECLTAAVYYEARSESSDGQRAVAQVVLNRVRDRAFPGSVCGVVYQGSTRRTGCQFSFTCDGSMYRRRDEASWERARAIAAAALGGAVYAPVGAATSYHASYMLPWWAPSLTRIGAVGAHIFYRWRNAMERTLSFRQSYAGYEPSVSPGGVAAGERSAASGVAVHYANDASDGSVTIHRGGDETMAPSQAGPAASALLVAGVRIHRGDPPPTDVDPT